MPIEDDDPVIASYDIYISALPSRSESKITKSEVTEQQEPETTSTVSSKSQKLYLLQYPSHRPANKPYTSKRAQKPTSLRVKQHTGIFEVDVPLLVYDNYNETLGKELGAYIHESQTLHPTTGHGLSGGFAQNAAPLPSSATNPNNAEPLRTQTLGGKVSGNTDKDPIYMLGTLDRDSKELHLRHLDAVVQMRPQLHHIDAQDEAKRRAEVSGKSTATGVKTEVVSADGKAKLETRAIEMKMKDSTKDDPKDRNLNWNAKLLRAIQNDPWVRYDWVESGDDEFKHDLRSFETSGSAEGGRELQHKQLKSAMDNDEWLNRMSSPGIELRTRLKGRDRERARRKRQERLRAAKAAGVDAASRQEGDADVDGSDTMGSEEDVEGVEDEQTADMRPFSPEIQVKQESAVTAPVTAIADVSAPKRRGRPPKNKATETIDVD